MFSGFAEGIGLALFVPLLHLMFQGGEQSLDFPFDRIQLAFDMIGIPMTLPPMLAIIFILIITSLGIALRSALHGRQDPAAVFL